MTGAMTYDTPVARHYAWVAGAVALLLTLASHYAVLGYGFTDVDALMDVTEARVDSPRDILALVAQQHTGGRAGVTAKFYRPVTALAYAAVRSVSGWNALGYHVVDLFLHALCGFLLALLARRLAHRVGLVRAEAFGLAAAVIHLLHPLSIEVVPAIARSGDLLVTAFALSALLALDRALGAADPDNPLPKGWRGLLPFWLLFGAALGAKEVGVLWLAVSGLWILLVGRGWPAARRGRALIQSLLPCLVLSLGFLVLRAWVLGEASGGYHGETPFPVVAVMVVEGILIESTLPAFARSLMPHLPHLGRFALADWLWLIGGCLLVWGGLALLRAEISAPGEPRPLLVRVKGFALRPDVLAAGFALLVVAGYAALLLATRTYQRRLLYPVLPYWSLLLALAVLWLGRGAPWRDGFRLQRFACIGFVAGFVPVFLWQSPLVHRDREWQSSGQVAKLLIDEMEEDWASLPVGARVDVANLPTHFSFDPARRGLFSPFFSSLAPDGYAIQAWLDDRFPERRICVHPIALHVYEQPMASYRSEMEIHQEIGGLSYRTPRSPMGAHISVPIDDERVVAGRCGSVDPVDYRSSSAGDGRTHLTYAGTLSASRNRYVLVIDPEQPRMIAVRDLLGGL